MTKDLHDTPNQPVARPERLLKLVRYSGTVSGDLDILEVTLPDVGATDEFGALVADLTYRGGEWKVGANQIGLCGDLGSGKTHFTTGFLKRLDPDIDVSSPTFSLINDYKLDKGTLHHLDFYRIDDVDELESIGFWDLCPDTSFCIIEWMDLFPVVMSDRTVVIEINYTPTGRVAYLYTELIDLYDLFLTEIVTKERFCPKLLTFGE